MPYDVTFSFCYPIANVGIRFAPFDKAPFWALSSQFWTLSIAKQISKKKTWINTQINADSERNTHFEDFKSHRVDCLNLSKSHSAQKTPIGLKWISALKFIEKTICIAQTNQILGSLTVATRKSCENKRKVKFSFTKPFSASKTLRFGEFLVKLFR